MLESNFSPKEPNIFADKSALVLEWLLIHGDEKKLFSIREVARTLQVSVGLVHKVFNTLHWYGGLEMTKDQKAKKFSLLNPQAILSTWIKEYNVEKKCNLWTYDFGSLSREKILKLLKHPKYQGKVTLTLHSAARELGYRYTNLETLELYVVDPAVKKSLEQDLKLIPQKDSCQVLLIEPYYKSMLKKPCSSPLLTFLDLYHYPLRGIEQAEHLASSYPPLKKIYRKRETSLW